MGALAWRHNSPSEAQVCKHSKRAGAPLPRARRCCTRGTMFPRCGRDARAAQVAVQRQRAASARRATLVAAAARAQAQARRRRPRHRVQWTRRPAPEHGTRQARGQRAASFGGAHCTARAAARARQRSGLLQAIGAAHTYHVDKGGERELSRGAPARAPQRRAKDPAGRPSGLRRCAAAPQHHARGVAKDARLLGGRSANVCGIWRGMQMANGQREGKEAPLHGRTASR